MVTNYPHAQPVCLFFLDNWRSHQIMLRECLHEFDKKYSKHTGEYRSMYIVDTIHKVPAKIQHQHIICKKPLIYPLEFMYKQMLQRTPNIFALAPLDPDIQAGHCPTITLDKVALSDLFGTLAAILYSSKAPLVVAAKAAHDKLLSEK